MFWRAEIFTPKSTAAASPIESAAPRPVESSIGANVEFRTERAPIDMWPKFCTWGALMVRVPVPTTSTPRRL